MRHLRLAALGLAVALAACNNPPDETGSASGSSTASSTGASTGASTSTSATTGASTGTTGVTTGGTAGTNSGNTSGATISGSTGTSGTTGATTATSGTVSSTTGTSGTTGSCAACAQDADCPPVSGATVSCINAQCVVSFPPSPSSGGTSGGVECATTGGSGSTGSVCATPCTSAADCPTQPDQTSVTCQSDGMCYYTFSSPSTGTGGGGAMCPPGSSSGSTTGSGSTGGGSTPLVLDFSGRGATFTDARGHFELGQGASQGTDWVDARTPWLALDRNRDGRIESGEELFGSLTRLPDGSRASNGFEALRALDANGDGRIDAKDPAFAQLVLWRDANQDRQSQPGELTRLADSGVIAIELGYHTRERCDARGNCERERAAMLFKDARGVVHRGEVVDVHLAHRPALLSAR